MIRKKTSSLDTINVQYAKYTLWRSSPISWPSGGNTRVCGLSPVQNTVTQKWGYHCQAGPHVYFMDSTTGDSAWLGMLDSGSHSSPDGWMNQGCSSNSVTLSGGGISGPEFYYCVVSDENGKAVILKCTITTTNQAGSFSRTCQNITPGSASADF